MSLPDDPKERKAIPIATGVWDYFPDVWAEVAKVSLAGNQQHMPGEPLHWDRTKSTDESDALARHFLQRYQRDKDGLLHAAKMVWRACAFTQKLIEELHEEETKEHPTNKTEE